MAYTDVHIEPGRGYTPVLLVLKTNGGQVIVEKMVGTDWVTSDTFFVDGVFALQLGRSPTRFTPSGGASYEVS